MKKPVYTWDEDRGMATCIIYYNNTEFKGVAFCHPDDNDMMSKLTGQTIAEWRAVIKVLRYQRDCELLPQLKILKQLYYAMNRSKHFNKKSYETKMLFSHIQNINLDLDTIKEELAELKQNLKSYIDMKDKCYQAIREQRKVKDN